MVQKICPIKRFVTKKLFLIFGRNLGRRKLLRALYEFPWAWVANSIYIDIFTVPRNNGNKSTTQNTYQLMLYKTKSLEQEESLLTGLKW